VKTTTFTIILLILNIIYLICDPSMYRIGTLNAIAVGALLVTLFNCNEY